MAKDVNILPNLRVDIPDFTSITSGFTRATEREFINKLILDNFSRISDGFRVEIADQTISPGVFTVYNGVSFDKTGQIINNEDELNASRSQTLSVDSTYYIEVEYITNESDTDARGFWDPSYSNGNDPSGDPRASGREFDRNVATRLSPDWQIVTPASTTAFAYVADSTTTKIPVAVITLSSGVIAGGSTSAASTILKSDVSATDTSLVGLDTRIMLDTFTLRINPGGSPTETITVSTNDRTSGLLSLSAGLANSYSAGTRLVCEDATPAQFLDERSVGAIPTSGTVDARPKLFQGDEEAGYILSQDPYSVGRSDVEVKKLKHAIDFLSAQIREIKFGHAQGDLIGNVSPPLTFNAVPKYYDASGGLLPARTNTVSIGTGSTSWGDFNTTQSGTAAAAFQAAHDALPANGGIIYVKGGTYTLVNTAVTVTKPIWFIGDGGDETIIVGTGSATLFSVNTLGASPAQGSSGYIRFDSLKLDVSTGFTGSYVVTVTNNTRLSTKNCVIRGGITVTGGAGKDCLFESTQFATSTLNAGICINGKFTNSLWSNCTFSLDQNNAGNRCVLLGAASDYNKFDLCTFDGHGNGTPTGLVGINATATNTIFSGCKFMGGSTNTVALVPGAAASNITMDTCGVVTAGGVGTFDASVAVKLVNCGVTFGSDHKGVQFDNTCTYSVIDDCVFTQSATAASGNGTGINFIDATDVQVSNCTFINNDSGIWYTTLQRASFSGLRVVNPTSGRGLYGIRNEGTGCTFNSIEINGLYVADLDQPDAETEVAAIYHADASSVAFSNVSINNLQFLSVNNGAYDNVSGVWVSVPTLAPAANVSITNSLVKSIGGTTTNSAGVYISNITNLNISNCNFEGIDSDTRSVGVEAKAAADVSIIGCNFHTLGNAGASSYGAGIHMGDVTTSATSCASVSIVGNNFRAITSSPGSYGVRLNQAVQHCHVSSNTFYLSATDSGVFIDAGAIGGAAMSDVLVNGNIIMSALYGIICYLNDTTSGVEGRISVNNNIIRAVDTTGVAIRGNVGSSVDDNTMFTVVGNTVDSALATVTGISIDEATNINVSNNNISLTSASGASIGIDINTSTYGTVSGNFVRSAATTGRVIDTQGSDSLNIVGNYVRGNTSSDGLNIGCTNSFVAANYSVNNGAGADIGTAGSGTLTIARAAADGSGDPDTSGSTSTDIGLNRRPD